VFNISVKRRLPRKNKDIFQIFYCVDRGSQYLYFKLKVESWVKQQVLLGVNEGLSISKGQQCYL